MNEELIKWLDYNHIKYKVLESDARRKILKTYRDSILLKKNESILKVIAADDSKLDGSTLPCSCLTNITPLKIAG